VLIDFQVTNEPFQPYKYLEWYSPSFSWSGTYHTGL